MRLAQYQGLQPLLRHGRSYFGQGARHLTERPFRLSDGHWEDRQDLT